MLNVHKLLLSESVFLQKLLWFLPTGKTHRAITTGKTGFSVLVKPELINVEILLPMKDRKTKTNVPVNHNDVSKFIAHQRMS